MISHLRPISDGRRPFDSNAMYPVTEAFRTLVARQLV